MGWLDDGSKEDERSLIFVMGRRGGGVGSRVSTKEEVNEDSEPDEGECSRKVKFVGDRDWISSETKSGLRSTVDVYREGNIRDGCIVPCFLTVVDIGGEGGLTGVAKKSVVRERFEAGFGSS